MNAGTIEPLDCTPAAEEVADVLHAVIAELVDRGYLPSDLIDGAALHLEAMREAWAQEARH